MEYTYSSSSPWTNVALAVAQQSSIAKLASPRIIERWGSLQREYHRMSRPKLEAKGSKEES